MDNPRGDKVEVARDARPLRQGCRAAVFHLTALAMGIVTGLAAVEPDPAAPGQDLVLDIALDATAGGPRRLRRSTFPRRTRTPGAR